MGAEGDTQGGSSTETPPTGMGLAQVQAGKNAESSAVQKWIKMHADESFVPVKTKRVTNVPKFDGAKPEWVFKTGDRGLGYYRDNGSLRTQLSLDLALRPMRSLPVATIVLDDLVITDSKGNSRERLASGDPIPSVDNKCTLGIPGSPELLGLPGGK